MSLFEEKNKQIEFTKELSKDLEKVTVTNVCGVSLYAYLPSVIISSKS